MSDEVTVTEADRERAAVVAWLRGGGLHMLEHIGPSTLSGYLQLADAIENREHLKE